MKTYSELRKLKTFKDRYEYLKFEGRLVGKETFGFNRYLNQSLYSNSQDWKDARRFVIMRDLDRVSGYCKDLGCADRFITGKIIVHHINPITESDILERHDCLFDPDNLICCSIDTHNAIHYGTYELISNELITRKKGDTKLW